RSLLPRRSRVVSRAGNTASGFGMTVVNPGAEKLKSFVRSSDRRPRSSKNGLHGGQTADDLATHARAQSSLLIVPRLAFRARLARSRKSLAGPCDFSRRGRAK